MTSFLQATGRCTTTLLYDLIFNRSHAGHAAICDGGEAGLRPLNIHDCHVHVTVYAYAIGSVNSINFTGDMPVILTRDGPSLGAVVVPCASWQ